MSRRHAREPAPTSSPRRLVALLSGPASGDGAGSRRRDQALAEEFAEEVEGRFAGRPADGTEWDESVYYASAYAARDVDPDRWQPRDRTDIFDVDGTEESDDSVAGTDPFRASGRTRAASPGASRRSAAPAVLELPETLAGARVRPRGLALLGMLLVVLVAAGLFAGRVWWAERAAVPEAIGSVAAAGETGGEGKSTRGGGRSASPGASRSTGAGSPAAGESGAPGPPTAAAGVAAGTGAEAGASADGPVVAHVVGEVRKPGVVTLPAAARVADAIRRVGGLSPKADATSVNLARPLVDGEQIVVLAKGASPAPARSGASGAAGPTAPSTRGAAGAAGAGGGGGAPIDLNTADLAALDQLPGVGPVLAERIIAWRTEHGRFSSVEELGEVSGVGEKTLERLRPLVRV